MLGHLVGFGTAPALPPDDHELVATAEKALSAIARNRRPGTNALTTAWVEVALAATRQAQAALPPRQQPAVAEQIELGDFEPTPAPGATHALRS